jgi:hypothetical protein
MFYPYSVIFGNRSILCPTLKEVARVKKELRKREIKARVEKIK